MTPLRTANTLLRTAKPSRCNFKPAGLCTICKSCDLGAQAGSLIKKVKDIFGAPLLHHIHESVAESVHITALPLPCAQTFCILTVLP